MIIKDARFVTSVADSAKMLADLPEIAFVGRSNVGKSSFINCLTNRNKLAKASSEPGRTRLINYFNINNGLCYFVDLPGYGFARVSDEEKERWSTLIESYLLGSKQLKNVFVILDIRHQPNELDKLMITFLNHYRIGFTVIATKVDKINKSQIARQVKMLADALCLTPAAIYPVSSSTKYGRERVLQRIDELLTAADMYTDAIAEADRQAAEENAAPIESTDDAGED